MVPRIAKTLEFFDQDLLDCFLTRFAFPHDLVPFVLDSLCTCSILNGHDVLEPKASASEREARAYAVRNRIYTSDLER